MVCSSSGPRLYATKRGIQLGSYEPSALSVSGVKQISSEDQKGLRAALVFLSDSSNDLFPDFFFPMKVFLLVRPRGLIQFICVQIIDCRDDILLASDLFCARVTKHSKIQSVVANPGSWRRHHAERGVRPSLASKARMPKGLSCTCGHRSERDSASG